VVSLHGSGECGTDGFKQMTVGFPRELAKDPFRFPFIAVMPQARTLWFRGDDAAAVWAILEAVHREYRTDRDRVYLTGFSMGGFATWELAVTRPDVLAGIVPICGIGPTAYMSNIRHLPVWAFHGAKDEKVPVRGSREPIAELKRLGANPKYTEYPNAGHTSWVTAYRNPKLWEWLLAQRRKPAPRVIDYRFPSGSAVVWWLSVHAQAGLETPAHIHAEIAEDGRVTVQSEGVGAWAIRSETHPLKIGDPIDVTWNDGQVYQGVFNGGIAVTPQEIDHSN
jgi:predicted esterase